jgi:hypothetical protein
MSYVLLAIGIVIVVLALLGVASIRALRRYVRSFWPHS